MRKSLLISETALCMSYRDIKVLSRDVYKRQVMRPEQEKSYPRNDDDNDDDKGDESI